MVEGFAESVGVVAIVRAEGVGECVAFSFEHEAFAAVVVEYLVHCCGG